MNDIPGEPVAEPAFESGVGNTGGERLSLALITLFRGVLHQESAPQAWQALLDLSLIHISEPTRPY